MSETLHYDPNAAPEPEPAEPKPKRKRKWLRRIAGSLAALVLLIVGLLAGVLYTSALGGFAVRKGLGAYSDAIPGSMSFGESEGALGSTLTLHDVVITDRDGRALVQAESLRIGIDVLALFGASVESTTLELTGAKLLLPTDGGGFGDLAPESDEPPPPPDPAAGLGPDLPISIVATLGVRDFELRQGSDLETGEFLVRLDEAELSLRAEGTTADATLALRGGVPFQELEVEQLELEAGWAEPVATVPRLEVRTDRGRIVLEGLSTDFEALHTEVSTLDVSLQRPWLLERSGLELARPLPASDASDVTLSVQAKASEDAVDGRLALSFPGFADLDVSVSGRPTAPMDLTTHVDAGLDLRPLSKAKGLAPFHLALDADVSGDPAGVLQAELSLGCGDCLDHGEVAIELKTEARPEVPAGTVDLDVAVADAKLDFTGHLDDDGAYQADLAVDAPALANVAKAIERFAGPIDLAGSAKVQLGCRGTVDPPTANCSTNIELHDGRPVRQVELDAQVAYAEGAVDAQARALGVTAKGFRVSLLRSKDDPPATVHYDPQRVEVGGLDLRLSSATGSGRVRVDGTFGLGTEHTLKTEIANLDLAMVRTIAPDLALGGTLGANLSLTGTSESPVLDGNVRLDGVAFGGKSLGKYRLSLSYEADQARAQLQGRGGVVDRLELTSNVGVHVDLAGGQPRLLASVPSRLRFEVAGIDLARVGAVASLPVGLTGTVDANVALDGRLSAPRIDAHVESSKIEVDEKPAGSLRLDAGYRSGTARAEVVVEHPAASRVELKAEAPVRLDLSRGAADWRSAGPHRAEMHVEGLELAKLAPWVPSPALDGRGSVHLELDGSMVEPNIEVVVDGDDLVVDERALGDLDVEVTYAKEKVSLTGFAKGPFAEGVGVTAEVPFELSPGRGRIRWKSEEAHSVDVAVVGLSLTHAIALAGAGVDVAGRGNVRLRLDDTPASPWLRATVDVEGFEYGGRSVGDVSASAEFRERTLAASANLVKDPTHHFDVLVNVPLHLDLAAGSFEWLRNERHELQIDAPRLDPEFVEPFVVVPEETNFALALHVGASGSIVEFGAEAKLEGDVRVEGDGPRPLTLTLEAGPKDQSLVVKFGDRSPDSLHLQAETQLDVVALVDGRADPLATPVEVHARADGLDLARFDGLMPIDLTGLEGQVALRADVSGTLGDPTLDGRVRMTKGAVTVIPLRQRLEDIQLAVNLNRKRIDLRQLKLRAGEGTLTTSGVVNLDPAAGTIDGSVALKTDKLPLRRPGLPRMSLTTGVQTKLAITPSGTNVDVAIGESLVDVSVGNVAAPKAIPTSDAVRYASSTHGMKASSGASTGAKKVKPPRPPDAPPIAVRVRLTDPFRIVGPSVDMSWEGEVRAEVQGDQTEVAGAFTKERGEFDLLGHRFEIETGKVTIPAEGGVMPYLDVVARTQVEDVEITATVRGRADEPELAFSSQPAFSQSEIFTMLVTGSADTQNADPDEVQAQAASMLAAFSNPALQRQLNDKLHVDKIGVTFGDSTDQPILSVGKNITQDLYAETGYHFNAPKYENRAQLNVRYRIAPRWSLETFFGDAAAGGVDLFWGRSYDIRRRRKSTRKPSK